MFQHTWYFNARKLSAREIYYRRVFDTRVVVTFVNLSHLNMEPTEVYLFGTNYQIFLFLDPIRRNAREFFNSPWFSMHASF